MSKSPEKEMEDNFHEQMISPSIQKILRDEELVSELSYMKHEVGAQKTCMSTRFQ